MEVIGNQILIMESVPTKPLILALCSNGRAVKLENETGSQSVALGRHFQESIHNQNDREYKGVQQSISLHCHRCK